MSSAESVEDVIGFKLYNTEQRISIMKFCGWAEHQRLFTIASLNQKVATRNIFGSSSAPVIKDIPQMTQQQVLTMNGQIQAVCENIVETEGDIPGCQARACIVAALHFDFHQAMGQSNFADPSTRLKEEATNI